MAAAAAVLAASVTGFGAVGAGAAGAVAAAPPNNIMWWNTVTGEVNTWLLDSTSKVTGHQILNAACDTASGCAGAWFPIGIGDVNGDGHTDLMWGNSTTGGIVSWLLDGTGKVIGNQALNAACGTAGNCSATWQPIGLDDVNGDGHLDLMWFNETSGVIVSWLLNGAGTVAGLQTLSARCDTPSGCSTQWEPIGTGDVNGDGHPDLMWFNPTSGVTGSWLLDSSGTVTGIQVLSAKCDVASACATQWVPIGIGDVNADGHSDLMWFNPTSGVTGSWLLNGAGTVTGIQLVDQTCPTACSNDWFLIGMTGPGIVSVGTGTAAPHALTSGIAKSWELRAQKAGASH